MKRALFLILILGLVFKFLTSCEKNVEKMVGIYGFNKDAEIFKALSDEEIADYLADFGINGVWGRFKDKSITDALHKRGIKTFFGIGIFSGRKLWEEFPDSRPVLSTGEMLEMDGWYAGVCPTSENVRKKKLKEIDEMFAKGVYDGVWLDFIRYPCHWEVKKPKIYETCFCDNCLNKFQKDKEIKIPDNLEDKKKIASWILNNNDRMWREWKCEQITDFCADVKRLIDKKYPGKILGVFGVPWRISDFNGAIKKIICQDYEKLTQYVDVFSPMSYHLMCNRNIDWIGDVTMEIASLTQKPVWVTIQAVSQPVKMSNEEFEKAIKEGLSDVSSGLIIYNFNYMMKENKWDTFVKTIKYTKM
ncbi:MAG: hypothetical protein HWN67_15340 [Candidatus Helarchaeota archaeon]|nr:hypothetical protein [Candidatus Helarchaeota archaeon]